MISNSQRDVCGDLVRSQASKRVRLSEFDGHKMAVIVDKGQDRVVLRGEATFVEDDHVGRSLQIHLEDDEPGYPVVVLSEDEWDGRIIPDFHYGCDFCLVLC